jgi:hypothetical protein
VQTYQSIIVDKISLYFKRGRHNRVYLVWMGDLHKKDNEQFAEDRDSGLQSKFRMEKFFKTKPSTRAKSSSREATRYEMNFDIEPIQVLPAQQKLTNVVTRFDGKLNIRKVHRIDCLCFMCLVKHASSHFVEVENDFIIRLYQANRVHFRKLTHKQKTSRPKDGAQPPVDLFDEDSDTIPNFFRNIASSLTLAHFQELQQSSKFLKEKNLICFDCYLRGATLADKKNQTVTSSSLR